jgi:hypothetical protein
LCNNNNIKGIQFGNEDINVLQFADDTTGFVVTMSQPIFFVFVSVLPDLGGFLMVNDDHNATAILIVSDHGSCQFRIYLQDAGFSQHKVCLLK